MGDIAKGVLGGAWAMLVGWILPSALNLTVLAAVVLPAFRHPPAANQGTVLSLLAGAVLAGVALNALQTPLYRVLEGYTLWPGWAYRLGCRRQERIRARLAGRLRLIRLEQREQLGTLATEETADLAALRADPRLAATAGKDRRRTPPQRSLLRERLARYPVDDGQVVPTRLGNAIRRLEEYGHDRYRLDTQVMWNELCGVVPEQIRRQTELSRVNVDFFVALLYGHLAVACAAAGAVFALPGDALPLLVTAVVLCCLAPVWYRCAVTATDEWAAAVRALVNVGRAPLAGSLGLRLPATLAEERAMWGAVCKMSRVAYHERAAVLDAYRGDPGDSP